MIKSRCGAHAQTVEGERLQNIHRRHHRAKFISEEASDRFKTFQLMVFTVV